MFKTVLLVAFTLGCLLLISIPSAPSEKFNAKNLFGCPNSNKTCNRPVESVGENAGCECFACEYKTKNQHIVCTKDEDKKRQLRALIEKNSLLTPEP